MKTQRSKMIMQGLAVLGTAGLLLTACADGSDGEGEDADEILIGLALSQSGNMAPFDVEPGISAHLAIDQINENGGIDGRTVRVIEKDVESNPETVGLATQELIDEGIDIFIGPCDFDLSSPGLVAAQAEQIPAFSICAGDPKTSDTTSIGDFAFTGHPGSDADGTVAAMWALEQGWENAFLLRDLSIEYTKSAGDYFEAAFTENGGTISGDESFPGGDTADVSSQISRLSAVADDVDFVYVASWNPGGATVMKQIREAGIDVPLIGPAAMDGLALPEIVGGTATDVFITANGCLAYCSGTEDSAELETFVEDFTAENGGEPSTSYALLGYNLILAIANGLEQTDSLDGADIRDALRASPAFETPIGEMEYFSDVCHKPVDYPMSIVELSGGELSLVEQFRAGDAIPDLGDGNGCATT